MTTVLACGEGAHDIGTTVWDRRNGTQAAVEGWMQPMIRKVLAEDPMIKVKQLKHIFLTKRPAFLKPIPKGHSDKAAMAKIIAANEGCELVIFMTDADTNTEKERLLKVAEIEEGFSLVSNEVSGVPCVPRSTAESWLLSDIEAWQQLGLTSSEFFPKICPEDLWGHRNSPQDDHPKHVFARVAEASDQSDGRETRHAVSELTSLTVLRERCPTSFVEFSDKLSKSRS